MKIAWAKYSLPEAVDPVRVYNPPIWTQSFDHHGPWGVGLNYVPKMRTALGGVNFTLNHSMRIRIRATVLLPGTWLKMLEGLNVTWAVSWLPLRACNACAHLVII